MKGRAEVGLRQGFRREVRQGCDLSLVMAKTDRGCGRGLNLPRGRAETGATKGVLG